MKDTALLALKADLKHDQELLVVKRRIIRILERLPDDESRRRVIQATAILVGEGDLLRSDPRARLSTPPCPLRR